MRSLPRTALAATLAALALTPTTSASAAASLTMTATPATPGTLLVGTPITFSAKFASPDRVSTVDGNTQLKAIVAKLPDQLVFTPFGFPTCDVTQFVATKTCPSKTKLGSAKILADGGPDVNTINATANFYFGTGYSVLTRIQADHPGTIDEAIIGNLQTSATKADPSHGYGLELYVPVSPEIQQPLDGVYPVVKSFEATITPPKRRVKVAGFDGKPTVPLTGLGPCTLLNFSIAVNYTDRTGTNITGTDADDDHQRCKR